MGDKEEADGEHASDTGGVRAALRWFSHWCRRPLASCKMSFSSMKGKGGGAQRMLNCSRVEAMEANPIQSNPLEEEQRGG